MDEQILFYLEDEQGREVEYVLVTTFALNDALYMALANTAEEGVFHLTGYHADDNDQLVFDPIEDEELYDVVAQVFQMELEYIYGEETAEAVGELADQEEILYEDELGRMFYLDEQQKRQYIDETVEIDDQEG